jgi:hypothetical protein
MDAQFMTVSNAETCTATFSKYMLTKYNFSVDSEAVPVDLKKLMFKVMTQVQRSTPPESRGDVRRMNNVCLNIARDFYVSEFKLEEASIEAAQGLQRDRDVFERTRPLAAMGPAGSASSQPTSLRREANVGSMYERLMSERQGDAEVSKPVRPEALAPSDVQREDTSSFMQRFADLEQTRNAMQQLPPPLVSAQDIGDPALDKTTTDEDTAAAVGDDAGWMTMPQDVPRRPVLHYLCINGFDRDWTSPSQRQRFRFTVDITGKQRYKGVTMAEVVRVVIPMEISDERTIANVPKTSFTHEFSMAFPYVGLRIDELAGNYDGPGEAARGAISQLVYENAYKSPNGRGYVVLKSLQSEVREFAPTPMDMLSRLSVSLVRPTGALFNQSRDDYKIWKVDWDPINEQFLRVFTTQYFDKNEFFKGDSVLMQGTQYDDSTSGGSELMTFLNRPEGHDIIQIGQPNDSGFYRSFYIDAPGTFDSSRGRFVVHQASIDALLAYNRINEDTWTMAELANSGTPPPPNGSVLNLALQVAIGMRLHATSS